MAPSAQVPAPSQAGTVSVPAEHAVGVPHGVSTEVKPQMPLVPPVSAAEHA
jgi:hypothetical protein